MLEHENFKLVDTSFNGIYIGCVEDNNDPDQLGRVRVRILGLHTEKKVQTAEEGIPTDELPWAIPVNPITGGSVSGLGLNGIPVNGSWVAIFFIGGSHLTPAYFGSIGGFANSAADTTKGFNDPDGVYPKLLNQPDWNKYARGSIVDRGATVGVEPSNQAAPTYPNNTVLETPDDGIIVEHDSTPNKERWQIFHKKSKSYIVINPDGSIVTKANGKTYHISSGKNITYSSEGIELQVGAIPLTVELDGVVTKQCVCAFTLGPHPEASTVVLASKQ
jgi:hypothetical protein